LPATIKRQWTMFAKLELGNEPFMVLRNTQNHENVAPPPSAVHFPARAPGLPFQSSSSWTFGHPQGMKMFGRAGLRARHTWDAGWKPALPAGTSGGNPVAWHFFFSKLKTRN
jgi:hypothetical protein